MWTFHGNDVGKILRKFWIYLSGLWIQVKKGLPDDAGNLVAYLYSFHYGSKNRTNCYHLRLAILNSLLTQADHQESLLCSRSEGSVGGIFAEKFWEIARKTPFYEEILFENCCKIKESTIKNLNQKRKIYFNYYKYKLMTALTKNSKKERYEIKKMELKEQIRNIRHYSKL